MRYTSTFPEEALVTLGTAHVANSSTLAIAVEVRLIG